MNAKTSVLTIGLLSIGIVSTAIGGVWFLTADFNQSSYTEEGAIQLARDFLLNCPTFRFDGIADSVKMLDVDMHCPSTWGVVFSFDCTHSGYGDRTGQVLLQVITPHTMDIIIREGQVTSAVIDGEWDEVNQKPMEKYNSQASTFQRPSFKLHQDP